MKNKTKGESPEEMITPKDIRKVKEAVKEIIPAHRQVRGRPREYSDRTIVLLYVLFTLFRCSVNINWKCGKTSIGNMEKHQRFL